jgi:hypothetical protein
MGTISLFICHFQKVKKTEEYCTLNITFPYLEAEKNEESSYNTSLLQGDGYPVSGATSQTQEHELLEVY